ncbi:hypothetical protein FVEG_10553 [Fusarium verticillioides 7600]|uniref:C2H2-type domain-containing protein n=1 Tax=Gibberella moniliformis (strain M3125 / FGSC 7600) TaxID=334819 RepID=W7N4S9_GIBM7|nr:hypothetical protein FVEG_10553 [Fusarium verticillioides 7600]EWG51637.1 hypothetical protein FVEG_10553 [Fusarium verticillioides 7600]
MHRLKEHLFRCHFLGCDKRTRCGRCKLIFPESEIQDHLILEVACEPTRVAVNYEDGFDTNQSDALKSLKPKQFETPVHQWQKTFNTVFPDWTADLPSPCKQFYHETSETECRIRVAQTLRSEEFRQEVWRNPSDMGREVFEGLANILDPSPSTATRPDSQSLSMPNELPMRPAITQENEQIALNPPLRISCRLIHRGGLLLQKPCPGYLCLIHQLSDIVKFPLALVQSTALVQARNRCMEMAMMLP